MLRALLILTGMVISLTAPPTLATESHRAGARPSPNHWDTGFNPHHHKPGDKNKRGGIELGPRPFYLVSDMDDGWLKRKLQSCEKQVATKTDMSIGHRGAAMQFPEHTQESYEAAVIMGAGIVECDVTFTSDRELVCRHSQCDLHTTTNILAVPDLAAKCSEPFSPFNPVTGESASAKCCTSDITLAEFKTLTGKMDGANPKATTVEQYLQGTPAWRTDLYASKGTLLTHKESIGLFKKLGVKFTPELKSASVPMPYEGDYTQETYAQQMLDEYVEAGVKPRDVWPQSFNIEDVRFWIAENPAFGKQAVYLDDANAPSDLPSLTQLQSYADEGIRIVAPPLWALLDLNSENKIVPSQYAWDAKTVGLDIITWSFERSGPMSGGGGWYYQTVTDAIDNDGDMYTVLDVLIREVGVIGVFSDWPASVTYYANCMKRHL